MQKNNAFETEKTNATRLSFSKNYKFVKPSQQSLMFLTGRLSFKIFKDFHFLKNASANLDT